MFNYLHSFLFLSETDNKFQSPNLEAKLQHRNISQTVISLKSNCFKPVPIKICFLNFEPNTWIKKYHLNTFSTWTLKMNNFKKVLYEPS